MSKVAIVTGASAGIGEATAKYLNQQGYTVFAGARRVEKMQHLAAAGINVHRLDVTDPQSNQEFVDFVKKSSRSIDLIVNSAGYGSQGALEDVSPAEAKNQFAVNVFGLMNLTQLVLPTMRAQHTGKIVNISSIGGQTYAPLAGWYYASKHALEALSDTLRLELKPFGIDVIIIEPGGTKTEWNGIATKSMLAQTPADSAYRETVEAFAKNPGVYRDTAEDIAQLIGKAINAKHPKTRYQPRLQFTLLVLAARKLSYKAFDKLMTRFMKQTISSK